MSTHDVLTSRYGSGEGRVVAVTGSTGLIGEALVALLEAGHYRVLRISQSRGVGENWVAWDPIAGQLDGSRLEGIHGVVHLAGESIAGLRWTEAKRRRIRESRVQGTRLLARTLAGLRQPPEVLVSASAVGYYGDRGDEWVTETSAAGEGFLADVCRAWEQGIDAARDVGIRSVLVRSGVVLSPLGGVLGTMLLPFKFGLGGRVGSGHQFMSWIDLDDEVGLILHALCTSDLEGPLNATAPSPVRNAEFTETLANLLRRPAPFPLPGVMVRAALGDMGRELLLYGQRVRPDRALQTGYTFQFPALDESLRHQLGRDPGTGERAGEGP